MSMAADLNRVVSGLGEDLKKYTQDHEMIDREMIKFRVKMFGMLQWSDEARDALEELAERFDDHSMDEWEPLDYG